MTPDDLKRLVAALGDAAGQRDDDDPAQLVRVVSDGAGPDGFELGLLDIDGHPADALLGLVAPDDWMALGVIGRGTAFSMTDPDNAMARMRSRFTVVMARDGAMYGGATLADGRVLDEPPTEGIIPDCLRRAFGLPTAPPGHTTAELFAVMWLAAVVAAEATVWDDASALHPAVQLLAGTDLVPAANAMAKVCRWPMVRELIASKGWWHDLVPPEHVEWMDDGLLSRWMFGAFPPLTTLLRQIDRQSGAVARQARATLPELGVPAPPAAA